jgi:HSP20 family protein
MYLINIPRRAAVRPSFASLLADPLFDSFFDQRRAAVPAANQPALDVSETETAYTATIDLPGIARDDVKVSIDGRKVSIEAAVKTQAETPAATEAQPAAEGASQEPAQAAPDAIRVVWRERSVRKFSRTFTLPVAIDEAASQAKLDNGVLTLTLAKKAVPAAAQLTVQ